MKLTETHQIGPKHKHFRDMCHITHLSKNLYNAGLYDVRQNYFETKKYKPYYALAKQFCQGNPDYKALPAKVAQQTLKLLDQNFKSFFALRKKNIDCKIPYYLEKQGHFSLIYTNQALSFKDIGFVKLSGTDIKIQTDKINIQQIRITPRGGYFNVEVVYSKPDVIKRPINQRFAAVDLGLTNLAACVTNVTKPVLFNGKPIKSINHFYNKSIAKQKSIQEIRKQGKSTNKTRQLSRKRNNKILDYMHKTSSILINHLVSNDICHLFIGENKGWKQEINIGKRNNQNFVQVPFNKFKHMLDYKAKCHGIGVSFQEESYTSKASFLSNDIIPVYKSGDDVKHSFSGHRVKRGLYKDRCHGIINADVNGAYNILRKAVGDFNYDPIQVRSAPAVITAKFN